MTEGKLDDASVNGPVSSVASASADIGACGFDLVSCDGFGNNEEDGRGRERMEIERMSSAIME